MCNVYTCIMVYIVVHATCILHLVIIFLKKDDHITLDYLLQEHSVVMYTYLYRTIREQPSCMSMRSYDQSTYLKSAVLFIMWHVFRVDTRVLPSLVKRLTLISIAYGSLWHSISDQGIHPKKSCTAPLHQPCFRKNLGCTFNLYWHSAQARLLTWPQGWECGENLKSTPNLSGWNSGTSSAARSSPVTLSDTMLLSLAIFTPCAFIHLEIKYYSASFTCVCVVCCV